jgi:predicted nucleotidyltransferase
MMSTRSGVARLDPNDALRAAAERYAALLRDAFGDQLVSVVLFGSVARGEARPDSDIDLLVVAEDLPDGRFARLQLLERVDKAFDPELAGLRATGLTPRVTPLLKSREEAAEIVPLYLDLVEDGRLLYDPDGFFRSVLDRLIASMRRLGSERRVRGKVRYWVLKPDLKPGEVFDL